jgi:hypothetical protein
VAHESFQALNRGRASTLALLLLTAIVWGTTAEVTHHHSAPGRSSARQLTTTEDQNPSQRVEAPDKGTSSNRTLTRDECLICQLHQNLFATLLSHAPQTAPAASQLPPAQSTQVSYFSRFHIQQQGRAPPSIL